MGSAGMAASVQEASRSSYLSGGKGENRTKGRSGRVTLSIRSKMGRESERVTRPRALPPRIGPQAGGDIAQATRASGSRFPNDGAGNCGGTGY